MSLRSLMKVLSEVRYDIIAVDHIRGYVTVHKFDYATGNVSLVDVDNRYNLIGRGAKVEDISNINGVMTIRVSYTMAD